MKIEYSGFYKTQNGRIAEVVVGPKIVGYIIDHPVCPLFWNCEGQGELSRGASDLVEYLGKERPKKKTIKMAPVLFKDKGLYSVGKELFSHKEYARACWGDEFVRWLIDTPYEIEIEVEE